MGALLVLNSCDLDDNGPNFHFTSLQIVDAEVPESFELGQVYEIKVRYVLPDGCTFFEGFDVSRADTTVRNVIAVGATSAEAQACTTAIEEGEASFNFEVIYDQPYLFRFWQGSSEDGEHDFFEVEVPVN